MNVKNLREFLANESDETEVFIAVKGGNVYSPFSLCEYGKLHKSYFDDGENLDDSVDSEMVLHRDVGLDGVPKGVDGDEVPVVILWPYDDL